MHQDHCSHILTDLRIAKDKRAFLNVSIKQTSGDLGDIVMAHFLFEDNTKMLYGRYALLGCIIYKFVRGEHCVKMCKGMFVKSYPC